MTLDRRRFLGLSAGGAAVAAGAAALGPLAGRAAAAPARTHYPAIVVGSGFGGSVAALRLGKAGVDTLLLERGRQWKHDPHAEVFGTDFSLSQKTGWSPGPFLGYPGVMETLSYPNMTIMAAACVGGGSVIYTGVTLQPTEAHFRRLYPSGLSYAELDRVYYPRVRRMLSASTIPADVYNSAPFTHSRVFDQQMAKAKLPTAKAPSTFDWDVIRKELSNLVRPSAIRGESNYGNSDGAKHDLTRSYLPAAQATGHVELSPLSQVASVGRDRAGRYEVVVNLLNASAATVRTITLTCDKLFLSAGSANTTKLLVAARETGALPNLSPYVGTGWGDNGDQFNTRTYLGPTGPSQASPCASTTLVQAATGIPIPTRAENWYLPLVGGTPILLQFSVALDHDNRGTWTYDKQTKSVSLNWAADASKPAQVAAEAINRRVCEAAGNNALAIGSLPTTLTAHPVGGVPIGKATDLAGRLKGYRGLYAVDGSLIPGNIGAANPSLTIAAIAERAMDRIVAAGG